MLWKPLARSFSTAKPSGLKDVVIVSAVRTPIGSFQGALASFTAPQLGAAAVKSALVRAGIVGSEVQEIYMGNVVSSGTGQAPARQVAIGAGLSNSTVCTTINKVCSSGMKATMLAAQSIMLGDNQCAVSGGMESMSNIPFYLDGRARGGLRYGHGKILDGIMQDGLQDAFQNVPMGQFAEETAEYYKITRQEQDAFAVKSYTRALDSIKSGRFAEEIAPLSIPQKKKDAAPVLISTDEEPGRAKIDRFSTLPGAFGGKGTVTAANASSLNDGAAALVLMSAEKAKRAGLKPLARIRGFADAEQEPNWFTTAPSLAIPRVLANAGVAQSDVEYWEINEAFSVVALANERLLNLDPERLNVNGGAVALGHPIGCSGARIIVSLLSVLKQRNATIGCAAICNGGGGSSGMVIERL